MQTPCNNSIKRRRGWRQEGHPAIKRSLQQTRMTDNNKESMPHRLSRGETRGASAGEPLASIRNKWTTVVRTHTSTSRTFGKRAGDMSLRIGTLMLAV